MHRVDITFTGIPPFYSMRHKIVGPPVIQIIIYVSTYFQFLSIQNRVQLELTIE